MAASAKCTTQKAGATGGIPLPPVRAQTPGGIAWHQARSVQAPRPA